MICRSGSIFFISKYFSRHCYNTILYTMAPPRLQVLASSLTSLVFPSSTRPPSSLVLTSMLRQASLPPWSAWYVSRGEVVDDQWGRSHFNWQAGLGTNTSTSWCDRLVCRWTGQTITCLGLGPFLSLSTTLARGRARISSWRTCSIGR